MEGKKSRTINMKPNEILLKSYADTQTNEITFSNLATSISSNENADEHFIRRFVLLMIGTVLAPKIKGVVPKRFLNLVEDVTKIQDYNWAEFTRCELIRSIMKFKKDRKGCFEGNLLLLQIWYFEHFQVPSDKLEENIHQPLIQNWDEDKAYERDVYDTNNGHGSGIFVLRLCNSEKHGPSGTTYPHTPSKQNPASKTCNGISKECMDPSDQSWMKLASFEERIRNIEDKVSYVPIIHDMLKKLLQSPTKDVRMPSKAFNSNDTSKENTPDLIHCNDGTFSEERKEWYIPDLNDPVTFEKGVPEDKEIGCGEEKVEHSLLSGSNQKTTTEDTVSTPADKQATANQKHDSSRRSVLMNRKMSQLVRKLSAIDDLAIQFVRDYISSAPTEVLVQITGAELTGSTLCKLIDPEGWLCEKIMDCYIDLVSTSRMLNENIFLVNACTSKWLRFSASTGQYDRIKRHAKNWGQQYIKSKMVLYPINHEDCHWFVGALDFSKQEFQIFNSMPRLGAPYEESTQLLREAISILFQELSLLENENLPFEEPNVCRWPIRVINDIPLQTDNFSCGVFSLKYMQFWDGHKFAKKFSADDIGLIRMKMVAELLLSQDNAKTNIREEVHELAQKNGLRMKRLKL